MREAANLEKSIKMCLDLSRFPDDPFFKYSRKPSRGQNTSKRQSSIEERESFEAERTGWRRARGTTEGGNNKMLLIIQKDVKIY